MQKTSILIKSALLALFFFLPCQAFAADGEFVVLPGDVLQISVWKEEGMDLEVRVLPDGTISFPLTGTFSIKNKTLSAVRALIVDRLRQSIPAASVSVAVVAPLGHKVSVLGEVGQPGEVIMYTHTGVMQALSQVGGLTPYADEDDIIIIRTDEMGKKEIIEFPYTNITRGKNLEKDINLAPGDVVLVPTAGLF